MFRLTRPLLQQVLKKTTGITGLAVHPNPLPELARTYESTLSVLSTIPHASVYRQSAEALTKHKLDIRQLDEGQIEESLDIAKDELKVAENILEWKAWEPLEERPPPGQWEYFGNTSSPVS
ncbi:Ndufa5, NADH-ubiquinone oxidoreductase subunit [Pisolithus marmoratus]|nr:Ndufa5, NADH-ubiquinone oxidoreductase subunit [Pisolithus marmoratus]